MRRCLLATASAGALLLFAAPPAAAAPTAGKPPAGSPDPAQMVLRKTDFRSASVLFEEYAKRVEPGFVSSYSRGFGPSVVGSRALDLAVSGAEVAAKAKSAVTLMAQLRRLLGTKAGRDAFKKELQDILGDGGSVTVGAPRSLGLGDDSLEFPIKMHDSELDLTLAFAYIRVDRVVDSLFIASPRSLGLFAAAKTLGRLMVTRTRSELAPKNTSLPTITGTPQVGQVLTASAGTWGGTPRFAYQWLRCGATGPCSPIAGATAATYTPTDADVGSTLRVAVTATNPQGSRTVQSAATSVVTAVPAPPANTAPPTVAGTPQQGQTLTANPGTWTGSPTFAYQWQRCDSAGTCTDIPGATAQTYVVTPSDVGFSLRVVVTATNAFGSTKATSAPTAAAT